MTFAIAVLPIFSMSGSPNGRFGMGPYLGQGRPPSASVFAFPPAVRTTPKSPRPGL
ncbi:unnamed protein product, partial [Nesidiocoris tenuis]